MPALLPRGPLLHPDRRRLPLWMKLAITAFLAVLVPVYCWHYGPANFLWFSDIALFFAAITLWTGRREPACVAAVMTLVPEIAWNVDFLVGLATGWHPAGIAGYMAEDWPLYLRALSLFHIPLPIVLLYLVHKLGYDRRALWWAISLSAVVLAVTWLATEPGETNINWVHAPGGEEPQTFMHPALYLVVLIVAMPIVFFLPSHLFLAWWRGTNRRDAEDAEAEGTRKA